MKESSERRNGAILSYVTIFLTTIVQLVYTPFLIKQLGQSEYGLFSLINSIIGYLTILDLGFGNAIVVYSIKYRTEKKLEQEQKLLGMFNLIFKIIGIFVALIGVVLFFSIDNIFGNTMSSIELHKAKIMSLILTFNLIVTFSFAIYSSILTSYEKFTYQRLMSILNIILKPLLMIPLLFLGYKSITLCIVITIINTVIMILNYFYTRKKLNIKIKYQGFDKNTFKIIFSYSFFIFLGTIVDKINWSVDQFVLGAVSGTIAVSIYSVASSLNTLFISLSTAISGVFLPKMTKLISKKADSEELTNEMIKVGRIQYFIIFLMATGLVLVGKNFIIWWVGSEYETSYYVALLLILPLCFPLIQNLGLSIMQAMNKYKFKAIATFIMALFNVVISYYLAKIYGAIGAALGTTISLVLCNIIIMNIYYKVKIKLDIFKFWKEIAKMTLSFIPSVIIILIVMNIIKIPGILGVIIYALIYGIIYLINCYLLTMNNFEKDLIMNLLKRKS